MCPPKKIVDTIVAARLTAGNVGPLDAYDARAKYKEQIDDLRKQSKVAIAKLDEMKTAGEETWESMVDEMEKVRDAFKHSFNYFKSQL